jgi:hypothetical protein
MCQVPLGAWCPSRAHRGKLVMTVRVWSGPVRADLLAAVARPEPPAPVTAGHRPFRARHGHPARRLGRPGDPSPQRRRTPPEDPGLVKVSVPEGRRLPVR